MLSRGASVKNCLHTRGMLSTRSSSAILRHRGSLIAGRNSSPFYFFFSFRHSHRICYDQSETVYSTIAYIYKKHLFLSICIYANFFDYDIFFWLDLFCNSSELVASGGACDSITFLHQCLQTIPCFVSRLGKTKMENGKKNTAFGYGPDDDDRTCCDLPFDVHVYGLRIPLFSLALCVLATLPVYSSAKI